MIRAVADLLIYTEETKLFVFKHRLLEFYSYFNWQQKSIVFSEKNIYWPRCNHAMTITYMINRSVYTKQDYC